MKIIIKVKSNAKNETIERVTLSTQNLLNEEIKPDIYKVSVKEPPVDGKANRAIVKAIAKHFKVAPSCVEIKSGLTSKTKIIEIH